MNMNTNNVNQSAQHTNDTQAWAEEQAFLMHLRALRDSGSITEDDYISRAHINAGGA